MIAAYLDDEEVRVQIEGIWTSSPRLGFTGKLLRVVKNYRGYCVWKAQDFRIQETELWMELARLITALHSDPHDLGIQGKLSIAADRLQNLEQRKAADQRVRSRIQWKRVESCSK